MPRPSCKPRRVVVQSTANSSSDATTCLEMQMSRAESFGRMVRERRRALDLTQDELARRVGCAPVTIRKIEYDELRPSQQIAERLAMALAVPLDERAAF